MFLTAGIGLLMYTNSISLLLCLAAFVSMPESQRVFAQRRSDHDSSYLQKSSVKTRSNKEVQARHLRKVLEFPAESAPVTSITTTRDGSLIAYTIDRYKRRSALGRVSSIFTFDLDKIFRTDTTLKIWDRAAGQLKTTVNDITVDGFVESYLTPEGKTIVTRDAATTTAVKLWSAETGGLLATLVGPAKGVTRSTLSPDGSLFATGYFDGTARLWTVPGGELKTTLGSPPEKKGSWFKRWINDELIEPWYWVRLYFSPDSKLLATVGMDQDTRVGETSIKETKVWDTATGQLRFVIPGSDYHLYRDTASDLFSPDSSILATTYTERNGAGNLTANSVKLWSTKDGSLLKTLEHACDPVRFSRDGKRLATSLIHWDDDGTWDIVAQIWNVETGVLERSLRKGAVDELFWSPDGRTHAATGGGKYTLSLWDVPSGQLRAQIRLVRHHCFDPLGDCISDEDQVLFSPDGRFLIAANKKSLRIIDAGTGAVLETIEGIGRPAVFLSNGQLVTRSANKKSVMVWEILGN